MQYQTSTKYPSFTEFIKKGYPSIKVIRSYSDLSTPSYKLFSFKNSHFVSNNGNNLFISSCHYEDTDYDLELGLGGGIVVNLDTDEIAGMMENYVDNEKYYTKDILEFVFENIN